MTLAQKPRRQRVASAYSQGRRHGLAAEEIEQMRAAQQGLCAICERPLLPGAMMVDHDHKLAALHGHAVASGCRKCVRGLLCRSCNTNLGWFERRAALIVDLALSRRPRGR